MSPLWGSLGTLIPGDVSAPPPLTTDGPAQHRARTDQLVSHPHPELQRPPKLPPRRTAGRRARRARRDRPQHDRLRVRREAAHRRLRRALPRGAPAGRRRDPARLQLHPGPPRLHRRRRAHPRPRGPHRRCALPAARARRHPGHRLAADAGADHGEAQGAPDPPAARRGQGGRPRRSFGPFDLEFLAVNHSIPDGLAVGDPHRRRPGPAHRRLQDGPVPPRQADHRPARLRPAGRGGRRPVPHRLHQRRGPRLHDLRA